MAKMWGVSEGLVRRYCREGRVPTAVLEEEGWLIPEGTPKPGTPEAEQKYMIISPVAKRVVYEHGKNNHFGIYEYIQVNLAYSSCRMASNRLTRKQVIELYRTDKLTTSFEPAKTDDVIDFVIDGVQQHRVSVVLQHDIHYFSVAAVEKILRWGKQNGYQFLALRENSPGFHQDVLN